MSIVVNQKTKNRSRLVNGDSLTIGAIKLDVEMPQLEVSNAEFHVNFDDEESPSTLSDYGSEIDAFDDAHDTAGPIESDLNSNFDIANPAIDREPVPASDSPLNLDEKPDSGILFDDFDESEASEGDAPDANSPRDFDDDDEPAFSFGPSIEDDAPVEKEKSHSPDPIIFEDTSDPASAETTNLNSQAPITDATQVARPEKNQNQSKKANRDKQEDAAADTPKKSTPPKHNDTANDGASPQFSFDSNDPDDVELSEKDIEGIYDDAKIETFPTMSVSIADDIDTDSDSISVSLDHDIDLSLLDSPFDAQGDSSSTSGSLISGGINTGKFHRWQGVSLQPAIDRLIECNRKLNVFRCRGVQTQIESTSILRDGNFAGSATALFLLTSLPVEELQNAIRTNRWDDRMGHPRALRMFLEYAPPNVLTPFFELIDAVLFVEDGEPSLIRRDPTMG